MMTWVSRHHQNACAAVEFLERETPEFILPLLWPPNSPDLDPVDYSMWSISLLQEKVYKTRIADLDNLNITSEPSGPRWITLSLLQLCVSGVVVFQLVSGRTVVISSSALFLTLCFCDRCGSLILRWLVESNSSKLIFRSDFLAVVRYDVVRFNTRRPFN